jgi:hypothetical protein
VVNQGGVETIIPAHLTVWLKDLQDVDEPDLVFRGWLVDASGDPIKGTASRGIKPKDDEVDPYPMQYSGAIYLQSH